MTFKKGKYRHYKGQLYQALNVVMHSETQEMLVLYRPLYGDSASQEGLWVRPYSMFFENVEIDGKSVSRFAFIEG
jgi:hypothetical protein